MIRSKWLMASVVSGMFGLSACGLLDGTEQYIAPVATEVILINIPGDALAQYGVNAENIVYLYVAIGRLTDGSTTSTSPFSGEGVSDAVVSVTTSNGTFELTADGDSSGFYMLSSSDQPDFTYEVGGEYEISMAFSGNDYWTKIVATDEITLTSPEAMSYHAPATDLELTWTPASDTAAVSVFSSGGDVIYDNLPRDLNGLYQFISQSDVSSASVSGDNFSADEVYGIAVAGLNLEEVDEAHFSTNLNFLVSKAASGTAVMTAVYTSDAIPEIPSGSE